MTGRVALAATPAWPRRALNYGARLVPLVALLDGCAKAPAPPERTPTPTAPPPSASASASSAPSGAAPRWLGDGCHAGLDRGGTARARSGRIAEACAPGSRPLGEPKALSGPGELRFTPGPKGGCVRLIAVSEARESDVTLELVDPTGRSLATDTLPGSVALLGPHGPMCFAAGAELTAKVGFASGGGEVVLSVHRAE